MYVVVGGVTAEKISTMFSRLFPLEGRSSVIFTYWEKMHLLSRG